MKKIVFEAIGWYGTVAIIVAYAFSSFSVLTPTDFWYQVLNGTGALGVMVISFRKKAYQPGVLNVVWFVIAVIALIRVINAS